MLNIALPKGRLGDRVYEQFQKLGLSCPEMDGTGRRLVFENPEAGVRYLLVKPSDVAVYVVRGAADIGVVGKDVLLETEPDVYELCDLGIGKCRIVIAAKNGFIEDLSVPLRVATKYPHVTARHYAEKNRRIELIKLNGSIELAPVTGLSDVISDIVETGTTLKENNLSVLEIIAYSSARLIVNKSAYQFKREMIDNIRDGLERLK